MNIEVANRLQQLRKAKGLSQEELANILGLSRQAISKWERAETSPDTDNLICLARLYNISIDKLLDTSESMEEIKERIAQERIDEISNKEDIKEDNIDDIKDDINDDIKEDAKKTVNEEDLGDVFAQFFGGKNNNDDKNKEKRFSSTLIGDKVKLTDEEIELKRKREERKTNLDIALLVVGIFSYLITSSLTNDWSWSWPLIFVGWFIGCFLTNLFIDRTFSGISLMFGIGFACIIYCRSAEDNEDMHFYLALIFMAILFIISLIPIIAFVKFNMKNRKELALLNEKDELIRLQEKCKRIIEANENYKKEIKDIN